jgi:hypothetical protein
MFSSLCSCGNQSIAGSFYEHAITVVSQMETVTLQTLLKSEEIDRWRMLSWLHESEVQEES